MQEIVDHGYVVRGWLGIEVQTEEERHRFRFAAGA